MLKNMKKEKHEATREWVESQNLEDLESIAESSVVDSTDDYDTDTDGNGDTITTKSLGTTIALTEMGTITQSLKELFNSVNSVQTVGNVKIENSTGVHIGNITNINGNIQIIHTGDGLSRSKRKSKDCKKQATKIPTEERINSDVFMERIKFKIPSDVCTIIPRRSWLAQLPFEEYEYMQEPVEYVVISHTATESSLKQAINISIIRDIQCFHIESREWNDIAYNFLIGCDGNAYEGRGWGVVGAHTKGYNTNALGISFIGCFMRVLPSQAALNACKSLLKRGVEEGHLNANFKLICHCQCRSTESPGRKLFEEIKKWDHFYNIEEEE